MTAGSLLRFAGEALGESTSIQEGRRAMYSSTTHSFALLRADYPTPTHKSFVPIHHAYGGRGSSLPRLTRAVPLARLRGIDAAAAGGAGQRMSPVPSPTGNDTTPSLLEKLCGHSEKSNREREVMRFSGVTPR